MRPHGMVCGIVFWLFAINVQAAARLLPMEFTGEPQISMEKGVPISCGIRIIGIEPPTGNASQNLWIFDGSFMIRREGYGSLKGYLSSPTQAQALGGQLGKHIPLRGFWFRANGGTATAPLSGRVVDSDTPGAKLYVSNLASIQPVFKAIMQGEEIQVGVELSQGQNDKVFYGQVAFSEDQKRQVSSCITDMLASFDLK